MAAEEGLPALKVIAEATDCPKCAKKLRQPKSLPCAHSFCLKCVGTLVTEKNRIVCPQCRIETELDEHAGIGGLLEKSLFVRILEAALRACRNHQKKPVVAYCRDCGFAICEECEEDHTKCKTMKIDAIFLVPNSQQAAPEENKTEAEIVAENEQKIESSHADAGNFLLDLKGSVSKLIDEEVKKLKNHRAQELKKMTVRDAGVKLKLPVVTNPTKEITSLVASIVGFTELSIKIKSDRTMKLDYGKSSTPRQVDHVAANRSKFKRAVTSIKTMNSLVKPCGQSPRPETDAKLTPLERVTRQTHATDHKSVKVNLAAKKRDAIAAKREKTMPTPPQPEPQPEVKKEPPKASEEDIKRRNLARIKIRGKFATAVTKIMAMESVTRKFRPLYEGDQPEDRPLTLDERLALKEHGMYHEVWESKLGMELTDIMWDARKKGWVIRLGNLAGTRGDICYCDQEGALADRVGQGLIRGNGRLCYDTKRKAFVATDGCKGLILVTKTGTLVKEITVDDSECLFGATYCACEDLYVITDTDKHCVWFISAASGEVVNQIGSEGEGQDQFDLPLFVCHKKRPGKGSCHLLVTDTNNGRIKILSPKGEFLAQYGSYGSGEKQFRGPFGTCVDPTGGVIVCDHYNKRVVRFEYDGDGAGEEREEGAEGGAGWRVLLSEGQLQSNRPWCVAVSSCGKQMIIGFDGKEGKAIGFMFKS